jgi:cysteine desulfurase
LYMASSVYLDYAAATPLDGDVLAAMQPFFAVQFHNPSATYQAGRNAKRALDAARIQVAGLLGARPGEIIYTAGGTEANNLAIHGVLNAYPKKTIAVSGVEHDSVMRPAQQHNHTIIPVDQTGRIDPDKLSGLIDDETVLISVMYANNEVGTVQPIRKVTQIAEQIRAARRQAGNTTPLYVHADACQASNYLDLHVARLGVDMMTLNGGKMYGPKQSGVLYVASHVRLQPQITGGGQERGLRSGTENIAGCVGFAAALQKAQDSRSDSYNTMQELRRYFIAGLKTHFPGAVCNGPTKNILPNNVHITFPGHDNERILFALDERGIMAAAGSACSASKDEPSHVLQAMGISDTDAQSSIRFTMGKETTKESLDYTLKILADILPTSVY